VSNSTPTDKLLESINKFKNSFLFDGLRFLVLVVADAASIFYTDNTNTPPQRFWTTKFPMTNKHTVKYLKSNILQVQYVFRAFSSLTCTSLT